MDIKQNNKACEQNFIIGAAGTRVPPPAGIFESSWRVSASALIISTRPLAGLSPARIA